MNHEDYMRLAIESARTVASVPFGAVIVRPATGECLATGANRSAENPIFHGEIFADWLESKTGKEFRLPTEADVPSGWRGSAASGWSGPVF